MREFLNEFVTAYFNDILIYSENMQNHRNYVKLVLQRLRKFGLQVDITKCEFHVIFVKYLSLIIIIKEICMNFEKIQIIVK